MACRTDYAHIRQLSVAGRNAYVVRTNERRMWRSCSFTKTIVLAMNTFYRATFALLFTLAFVAPSAAQSFGLGADIVSRYIWRGTDFGESASIQPYLSFSTGSVEIGSWASYSVSADGANASEHDLYVSISLGSFSIGFTDYYFPAPNAAGFFNFDSDGEGAHWIEPNIGFEAPGSFPISLYAAMMVHNDPDNSLYLEANLPLSVEGVDAGITAGMVAGESGFYGTEGAALVNLGLSASKEIALSEDFSLPVSVAYIVNPAAERAFLVFGVNISL